MFDRLVFAVLLEGKQNFLGAEGKSILRFVVLFLQVVRGRIALLEMKANWTANFNKVL